MTTIGSTSYYTSTTYYAGAGRSNANADNTYSKVSDGQEGAADTAATASPNVSQANVDTRPSIATVNFQGKLFTATRLDAVLEPLNIAELPEDRYREFMEGEELRLQAEQRILENQYTQRSEPDLSNDPRMKSYATVIVAGKVVATIDNQGVVGTTDDLLGARLQNLLLDNVNGTNGPDLAQARAEQIAKLLGGRVVKADTAISQREFNMLPSIEPKISIDYEAMKSDPMYEKLENMRENNERIKQQREEYLSNGQGA